MKEPSKEVKDIITDWAALQREKYGDNWKKFLAAEMASDVAPAIEAMAAWLKGSKLFVFSDNVAMTEGFVKRHNIPRCRVIHVDRFERILGQKIDSGSRFVIIGRGYEKHFTGGEGLRTRDILESRRITELHLDYIHAFARTLRGAESLLKQHGERK